MHAPPDGSDRLPPHLEVEAKFYVPDLEGFRRHATSLGVAPLAPPVLERNWRFDRPDGALHAAGQVLRLRQDRTARLTFKEPSAAGRREIEVIVEDGPAARALFEGLGFVCVLYYEKRREVLQFEQALVMLDTMPFAGFVEVEAEAEPPVRRAADRLGLCWERRVLRSYAELIGILGADPSWPSSANVFADDASTRVDAGAALHLERAWPA